MANSADPDQLATLQKPTNLDLHCLQRQVISWISRTRVKLQYFEQLGLGEQSIDLHHMEIPYLIIHKRNSYSGSIRTVIW